jgi:hypothetical protein
MSKQPHRWRKFLECTTEFESTVTADWLGAKNQDPNFGPENGALYAWSAVRDLFLKNSPRGLWDATSRGLCGRVGPPRANGRVAWALRQTVRPLAFGA